MMVMMVLQPLLVTIPSGNSVLPFQTLAKVPIVVVQMKDLHLTTLQSNRCAESIQQQSKDILVICRQDNACGMLAKLWRLYFQLLPCKIASVCMQQHYWSHCSLHYKQLRKYDFNWYSWGNEDRISGMLQTHAKVCCSSYTKESVRIYNVYI